MSELERFVKEALRLPAGWTAEVYRSKRGKLSFSSPMTHNTFTKDPAVIGRIEALSIGDVDGFFLRSDGKVEIAGGDKKGEFYEECEIVSRREAIQRITQIADDNDWFAEILRADD